MTKVVIMDVGGEICSSIVTSTGAEHRRQVDLVLKKVLEQASLSFDEITCVTATGYGRFNVPFADYQITELTCHAKGVAYRFPSARIALDIGGQDAKGLKIDNGRLVGFVMNDRCAAGTGRFLEVAANGLGIGLEELGEVSLKSTNMAEISTTCTIFAQQEIVGHLSKGISVEDIVAGVHNAIASRAIRMLTRLKVEPDVVFTGGVAMNIGVVKAVRQNLEYEVFVPESPLFSGAIGAALIGKELASNKGEAVARKERHLEEATFFT